MRLFSSRPRISLRHAAAFFLISVALFLLWQQSTAVKLPAMRAGVADPAASETQAKLTGLASRGYATPPSLPTFDASRTKCDVLVIGGTPAGIAAALAAARRGADVILVEARPLLGGDVVYAMLNQFDVPARPGEASPIHGIFAEFYDRLGTAFSTDKARRLFEDTVAVEPTLHAYTRTRVMKILKEGDTVTGVVLRGALDAKGHADEAEVRARVVVDATNDASVAARAGSGYYIGRENAHPDKAMQSVGLLFSVDKVDWQAVRAYTARYRWVPASVKAAAEGGVGRIPKKDGEKLVKLRLGGMHGSYMWERGDIVKDYVPRSPRIMTLSINFGRQGDGTVVLNTLNVVGVNGLDPESVLAARREAIAELPHYIAYLRRKMPGFSRAVLSRVAPELYVRETRHIHGYYSLKVADIRAGTRFFDRIAMASYPLDLHPYFKGQINPFGARRYYYTLPLRSLVPRKVDGLFVASRSLSATYSAAGSARVIPITMAAGEAAGAAAWLCARQNISPHDVMNDSRWVRQIQESLREWGADIGDKYPTGKVAFARKSKLPRLVQNKKVSALASRGTRN